MPIWFIPITIVEHGREARIEAETKTEAIEKLHKCQWEELTDPISFVVTKVGACTREDEETKRLS